MGSVLPCYCLRWTSHTNCTADFPARSTWWVSVLARSLVRSPAWDVSDVSPFPWSQQLPHRLQNTLVWKKRGLYSTTYARSVSVPYVYIPFILLTLILGVFTLYQQRTTFSHCFFCTFAHLLFFSWSCWWFWHNAVIGMSLFWEKSLFLSGKKVPMPELY